MLFFTETCPWHPHFPTLALSVCDRQTCLWDLNPAGADGRLSGWCFPAEPQEVIIVSLKHTWTKIPVVLLSATISVEAKTNLTNYIVQESKYLFTNVCDFVYVYARVFCSMISHFLYLFSLFLSINSMTIQPWKECVVSSWLRFCTFSSCPELILTLVHIELHRNHDAQSRLGQGKEQFFLNIHRFLEHWQRQPQAVQLSNLLKRRSGGNTLCHVWSLTFRFLLLFSRRCCARVREAGEERWGVASIIRALSHRAQSVSRQHQWFLFFCFFCFFLPH